MPPLSSKTVPRFVIRLHGGSVLRPICGVMAATAYNIHTISYPRFVSYRNPSASAILLFTKCCGRQPSGRNRRSYWRLR